MLSFTRDSLNDLTLNTKNDIATSSDLEACLQACESAVSIILGEQIYNQDEGIPNFQAIWDGVPNLKQAEIAIINAIENVPNVIEVTDFDVTVENNVYSYVATIKTEFGTVEVSDVV